jgi:hypothetical protein
VAEIGHFAIKKVPSNMVKETFLENFLNIFHLLWKKKFMKLPKFFGGFGQLFRFLFLKSKIRLEVREASIKL